MEINKTALDQYLKEYKQIKWSFVAILFSASFVLSLGMAHQYQNLPEFKNLYYLAGGAYILAFCHQKLAVHFLLKKYSKKIKGLPK